MERTKNNTKWKIMELHTEQSVMEQMEPNKSEQK